MIKAYLLHLGMNLWEDNANQSAMPWQCNNYRKDRLFYDRLQLDEAVWHHQLETLSANGCNMVVIDLADGVRYDSHPEIGVKGCWSTAKLREELKRCRDLGLTPIPKLNFSTTHDAWMGEYSRMVSTKIYYQFCSDIIKETCELFDGPEYFHIGMDEEIAEQQIYYDYVVIRRRDILHHDLHFYFDEVRKNNSRPWMWADLLWDYGMEKFQEVVPKDILISNWYYGSEFNFQRTSPIYAERLGAYIKLEQMGYDQIACASNWNNATNYRDTVALCRHYFSKSPHFLGYMMAPWASSEEHNRAVLDESMALMKEAHDNENTYVAEAAKTWTPGI